MNGWSGLHVPITLVEFAVYMNKRKISSLNAIGLQSYSVQKLISGLIR